MANRAQRRALMRNQASRSKELLTNYTRDQRIERLLQQGISPEDLVKAREEGFDAGYKQAGIPTIEACYAAMCIALHDEFGFGTARCVRALQAADSHIVTMISDADVRKEALEKTGIEICLHEAVDRIGMKVDGKEKR